ncbi:hypothetical protein [Bacteroides sp.]
MDKKKENKEEDSVAREPMAAITQRLICWQEKFQTMFRKMYVSEWSSRSGENVYL